MYNKNSFEQFVSFINWFPNLALMTENNKIIDINNDKYLIRKTGTKLVLHHLPSLDIVHKYYAQVAFFCVNKQQVMILHKNVLTFLKPKCPPLRLIQYQQDYLDWQPIGGLSMANMVILYDKSAIAFYYRNPKLEKSWAIDVVQEIQEVKSSQDEKFIALKVKEPTNTIFVWDMGNMNKKPNQQIILKDQIINWTFYGNNILLIMTENQFKIYFVNQKNNQHFIQYYIPLSKNYRSFLSLNQFNQTHIHSGRKSVNTFAFLIPNSCNFDIVQLQDIQKRQRKFAHSGFNTLNFKNQQKLIFSQAISGYEYEQKILLLGQVDTGIQSIEPKCMILNGSFQLEKVTQYKQHQGIKLQNIQYQNDYVLFLDKKQEKYKLGRFIFQNGSKNVRGASENIEILGQYSQKDIQNVFLTKQRVIFINKDNKVAIQNLKEFEKQSSQQKIHLDLEFSIQFGKYNPKLSFYLFQNKGGIFFVCGIRYFKFDIKKGQFVNIGFVLKNERAKLHQVRTSTSSLVYKISEQHILIEYSTPSLQQQKVTFRTIKSSDNDKIISLRKDKWARVNLQNIIYGQGQRQLATFNLQRMYKTLLQDNSYFQYELFWTTHDGMILVVKNYLFFLQVTEGQNGSEIHLIKKGHSYLHRRFSSSNKSRERIQVIDPRNLVVFTGNRIIKLASQVEHYISQNPYDLPDTLLNRQLKMREYFCPHHPTIINGMLENGWFLEIVKLMEKVQQWINLAGHNVKQLYEIINISDYRSQNNQQTSSSNIETKDQFGQIMMKPVELRNQSQDIQNLNKLCEQIISQPNKFYLPENNPLMLENLLKSVIFRLQNSRAFDFFSETVITKTRIQQNKIKPFTTMDVAFLLHSINKDEALEFLKSPDHKMEWAWFQKYSIALWYDENVEKWKKWIQEIAMTQFRIQKDPFDCLFWYILAGKKNLLTTLFKAQKYATKEHDAMHTFLQRDFQDPKHKSAALKNAYALIDKKRYVHAMAFFLLADKKQECIRFAMDRLSDMNLAYLIHLVSYGAQSKELNQVSKYMIEKGDMWAQHIGWFKEKKHVVSYNVLIKNAGSNQWDYTPQLKGFHPAVIEFSQKIKESIPFKRELEQKNKLETIEVVQNYDYLTFNGDNFEDAQTNEKQSESIGQVQAKEQKKDPQFYSQFCQILEELGQEQENGLRRVLSQKSIKFYMRNHFPCLTLTLTNQEQGKNLYSEAKRAYELQKYILTGCLSQSVIEIAEGLDDIMGLMKNDIQLQNYDDFLFQLINFRQRFQTVIRRIKINELNPPAKHQIGEILHYSYFSEKIFTEINPIVFTIPKIEKELMILTKTNSLGKIISGISLKVYEEMGKSLQAFKNKIFIQAKEEFWQSCRQRYDKLLEKKKEKHQKLMDAFQLSLNQHIKKQKDQEHFDFSIRMPKSSTMSILLWRRIFHFLSKCDEYQKEKVLELKLRLDKIVKYWVEKEYIAEIESEIAILIAEGREYRLKLKVISEEFKEEELDTIEQLLKLVYSSRELMEMEEKKGMQFVDQNKDQEKEKTQTTPISNNPQEKSAIQVFKNKSDNLKNFTLNLHNGKGLEIVALFKKTMRKFQVVENLVNRDRTKDGLNLIHQDSAYVTETFDLSSQQQMLSKTNLHQIHQSTKNLYDTRKQLDGEQLIKKNIKYSTQLKDYLKPLEQVPSIDYHEINSIETHSFLPVYFLGGKGFIEVCSFDFVKNYNRIICPGMQEIVKMQSVGQRVFVLDKEGNLAAYLLENQFASKVVFELKKMNIIDFSCPSPSQVGVITANSLQFYDTLLHPKRQCIFKVQMSTPPVAISYLSPEQMVILRKNQVQVYDVFKGQLLESFNIQGRGKCLFVSKIKDQNQPGKIFVGRSDCKVKIIDLGRKEQTLVKIGAVQQQKEKVHVECIKNFGNCYFCLRSDGSIYYFSD